MDLKKALTITSSSWIIHHVYHEDSAGKSLFPLDMLFNGHPGHFITFPDHSVLHKSHWATHLSMIMKLLQKCVPNDYG